jgi:cardiolipin synthase A/B
MSIEWLTTLIVLAGFVLGALCAFHALMFKTRDASGALVWIVFCLTVPWIGAFLYVTIGDDRIIGRRRRRIGAAHARYRAARARGGTRHDEFRHPQLHGLTDNDVLAGNAMELFVGGEASYVKMLADIAAATTSVALQTYILDEDATGQRFRDALVERARAGVDVRVVYDSIGAVKASRSFIDSFSDGGVKIFAFLPFHPFKRRWQVNLRNHRKIVVVDGRVGYIGSMNLSSRHVSFGSGASHDLVLRVEGPVVRQLTDIFASDWSFAAGDRLPDALFFPLSEHAGGDVAQAVDSGPDRQDRGLHKVVVAACYEARRRLTIITPYFIPPLPVIYALESAAARGVTVDLLIPEKTDSRLMDAAIPHFLERVLAAGVNVKRKAGPMLHMKLMLVDDDLAIVGSSNMDARSYFLNFEVDLVVYGGPILAKLRELADMESGASRSLELDMLKRRPFAMKVVTRIAALFTPIL